MVYLILFTQLLFKRRDGRSQKQNINGGRASLPIRENDTIGHNISSISYGAV